MRRALGLAAVAVLSLSVCGRDAPKRPNVILIVMDTVRADHLSSYGYHLPTTPNIDRIARQGILYENAITPGSWTLPSHATLFTGLYPRDHGTNGENWHLDSSFTTLAEILAVEGYETIGFSNNPWISAESGLQQGFEAFHDVWQDPRRLEYGDDGAGLTNEMVLRWLADRSAVRPFFAFVHYIEPHFGYDPPDEAARQFVAHLDPAVVERLRQWRHPREVGYILGVPGMEVSDREFEVLKALYDGEIAYVDRRVGELVDAIDARGLGEETALVVTSDHGEHFGEHGLMDHKMSLYDALIRVPLILRYPPELRADLRVASQVQTNDLFVTLLKLCGVERPPPRSARLLPTNEEDSGRPLTYAEFARPIRFIRMMESRFPGQSTAGFDRALVAVRVETHKYIWASDGRQELYAIETDLGETNDLAEREANRLSEMRARRDEFWQ